MSTACYKVAYSPVFKWRKTYWNTLKGEKQNNCLGEWSNMLGDKIRELKRQYLKSQFDWRGMLRRNAVFEEGIKCKKFPSKQNKFCQMGWDVPGYELIPEMKLFH